jgi:anti-sigma-K factor RskA
MMTLLDPHNRFEELCAGRAIGELAWDEENELAALSEELGLDPDLAFELLAASIELDFAKYRAEPLPTAVAARLHRSAAELESSSVIVRPAFGARRGILHHPFTGWAAAAAIALVAALSMRETPKISPAQAQQNLRSQANDLVDRNFSGIGTFKDASGSVIWSDQLQQGYMTLSGIPVNDPRKSQYQLWIVDPKRDEAPIDGGVFDIPTDGSPVVIAIAAKLALTRPQAFVITLEQPGGVVKSKQEQVVALAKG